MKKNAIFLLLLALLSTVFISGCEKKESKEFKDENKISVVTTIYPMENFVKEIGGNYVEVINLVPAGMEPHDFELSTGDMKALEKSQMIVYNGSGMEHFMDKTLKAISHKDKVIVEASKGILVRREEDGEIDPHTWLSIENAKKECESICEALCVVDKEHEEYYKENLSSYEDELNQLYNDYVEGLKNRKRESIVVAHEAFGYMCQEFDIKQIGVEGLMADSEPDSARMKEVIDLCVKDNVPVIFFEELASPKVVETIAAETGAEVMVLNPIEGLTSKQQEEGADYISIMRDNLIALQKALEVKE